MFSSMSIDRIIPYYTAYRLKHYGEQLSDGDAKSRIMKFIELDPFTEISSKPRIILCSEGFSPEITTTVLWLRSFQIDISCVKITPYRVGEKIIIVPKIVIPLEEAKQYLIDIQIKEDKIEQSGHKNQGRTMRVLIENELVKPGDLIYLKNGLPSWVHYEEGNPMFQAIITGKLGRSDGVQWKQDGQEYSISALAWNIFKDLHPQKKDPGGVNGNWHWVDSTGRSLWDIKEEFLAKAEISS